MRLKGRVKKLEQMAKGGRFDHVIHWIDATQDRNARCECSVCRELGDTEYEIYHKAFREQLGRNQTGYIVITSDLDP